MSEKKENDTIIIIGVAAVAAYFLLFKKSTVVAPITSITPVNATTSQSGSNTANQLVSAGGGLFSSLANLLKPGSTPNASNVLTTTDINTVPVSTDTSVTSPSNPFTASNTVLQSTYQGGSSDVADNTLEIDDPWNDELSD